MAMESAPSLSVMTMGCLVIPPTPMMATFGWLMMGKPKTAPNWPGLVIVKVAPSMSVGMSFLSRSRVAFSTRCWAFLIAAMAFLCDCSMDPSVVLQGHGTLGEDDAIWKRNTDSAMRYWYLAAANWIAASVCCSCA